MERRDFLLALAAMGAMPPVSVAQPRVRTVALFWIEATKPSPYLEPLSAGLRAQGYVLGRDIHLDDRFMVDGYDALADAARRLIAEKPDVILSLGGSAVQALYKGTSDIPIVMIGGGNPMKIGVAKSLSKPGGNVTGLSLISADLSGKRLELLKESFPKLRRLAIVLYPQSAVEVESLRSYEAAARRSGIDTRAVEIRRADEIGGAIAGIARSDADGIIFVGSTLFRANHRTIVDAVGKTRLPAIYVDELFTQAGGLMSYGPNISEHFKHAATYIDKILKGAKPADLPIEQPTRLELIVNRRTAKAQNLPLPRGLLQRADRVIE